MGVDAIYLQEVLEASYPAGVVSNFYRLNPALGSKEDFEIMVATYARQSIAVVMRLCVDSTTQASGLFKDDQLRGECYPIAQTPNQWQDEQGKSLWHSYQGQYYLSHRGVGFPLLDWHSPVLRSKVGKVVRHWMDQGVKGFVFTGVDGCMYDPQGERSYKELTAENLKVVGFLKDVVGERSDCCCVGELGLANQEHSLWAYSGKGFDLLLRELPSQTLDLQALDEQLSQWQGEFLCYPAKDEKMAKNLRLCLLSYAILSTDNLLLQDTTSPQDLQSYRDENLLAQIIQYKKRATLGVEQILAEEKFRGFLLKCIDGLYLLGINFASQEFVWQSLEADKLKIENIKDSQLNGGYKKGKEPKQQVAVKPFSLVLGKMQW